MTPSEDRVDTRVLAVWGLFALSAVAVAVTYARVPVDELYNVSVGGAGGGLGRALVFLNFPTALVAIALALISVDRLPGRAYAGAATVTVGLCAVVLVPGVVDQGDLDAKLVNTLPALGVLGALALTIAAVGSRTSYPAGAPRPTTRLRSYLEKARVWFTHRAGFVATVRRHRYGLSTVAAPLAATLIFLASLPWIAAELGFYLDGPFLGSEVRPEPGHDDLRAVHLGHHHGMDGSLLALAAIALRLVPARMRRLRLRGAVAALLSLMLAYGLANAVQDFWGEQIVKRGWAHEALPSVLRPEVSFAWLGILVAAAFAYLLRYRPAR
jgi:hypothetical protein